MKSGKDPASVYLFAAGVAGQVGCLITVIVGGSVILGLLLDKALGTGRLFIFLFLVGSIPLNLFAIYRYTVYQSRRLQPTTPPTKEDSISDD